MQRSESVLAIRPRLIRVLEGPRNYGIRTAECSLGTAITDGETFGRSLALSSLLIASTQTNESNPAAKGCRAGRRH